ncbi:hypothetical protein FACS189494_05740 [Spirochaetia bacterium]|nr:hypothetical protein FACS189494_05740 [Spirochaetia bacterium]
MYYKSRAVFVDKAEKMYLERGISSNSELTIPSPALDNLFPTVLEYTMITKFDLYTRVRGRAKKFIIAVAAAAVLISSCVNLDDIVINNPQIGNARDGTYRGESKVGPVRVTLDVTVLKGAIKDIALIRHFNGMGTKAEVIIPKVIEAQSLNVDAVSGATASSKAILQAIDRALEQSL